MDILIVAATKPELEPLFIKFNPTLVSDRLYSFEINSNKVFILLTGVGMISTTFSLTKLFSSRKFDLAINAGICGSFALDEPLGKLFFVNQDSFPEMGAEDGPKFISAFQLGLIDFNQAPFECGVIYSNVKDKFPHWYSELDVASGVTINKVHGDDKSIEEFLAHNSADTESMEGAAFYYVCAMFGQPSIQIRTVSNHVEKRNREKWDIPLSVKNLNDYLISKVQL